MEQQNNLESAVDGLFAGSVTSYTTTAGQTVAFSRAGIKQLGKITKFINLLIERADVEKVKEFLNLVAGEQQALLDQGRSVTDINLNTSELLTKAMDQHSLILHLFGMMADSIPEFVTIFSDITEEQYNELALDEQLIIAAGILVVNYGFFTQSLPPIIKSAVRGFSQMKNGASAKANPAKK